MSASLNVSSYAILGLLALRDWSAYDLTQQARRSLRFAWPKSESHLYSEPRRLVRQGLASSRRESQGKRRRTVFSITDAGRAALAEWLRTRPRPPQMEAEAMLRLLFADQAGKPELDAALQALREDVRELHEDGREIVEGYLRGEHPLPERAHLSVLYAVFQGRLYRLLDRWVETALAELERWPDTVDVGLDAEVRRLAEELVADRTIPRRRPDDR